MGEVRRVRESCDGEGIGISSLRIGFVERGVSREREEGGGEGGRGEKGGTTVL